MGYNLTYRCNGGLKATLRFGLTMDLHKEGLTENRHELARKVCDMSGKNVGRRGFLWTG